MRVRQFIAHFCAILALATAGLTYGADVPRVTRTYCDNSNNARCKNVVCVGARTCDFSERKSYERALHPSKLQEGDTVVEYLVLDGFLKHCYFLDGKDQSLAQFTDTDLVRDPLFPRLANHILSLAYKTDAKEKIEVKINLRRVVPSARVVKTGNPPRLVFECTPSDDCIEIIPGGRVKRFRIGCTSWRSAAGEERNVSSIVALLLDYKDAYLQGM